MMRLGKKGSAVIEAALVFPAVILTSAAVISFAVSLYEDVRVQVEMHMEGRQASLAEGALNKGEAEFIRNLNFLMEGTVEDNSQGQEIDYDVEQP